MRCDKDKLKALPDEISVYRLFLENLDLSKIEGTWSKKVRLIRMVRTFATQFKVQEEIGTGSFSLEEAKHLVESVFTPEQLCPVQKCTDHTKWKAGDTIFTRDSQYFRWKESTFICYFEGATYPYITVDADVVRFFDKNSNFSTEKWVHAYKEIK